MVVRPSALQRGGDKKRRRHLESVSAAPYGSTFQLSLKSPIRIQPQLSGKGVLGHSPKRVLVPFAGAKGRPPRRAVLTKPFIRLRDADRRLQTIPRRAGVQVMPLQKAPPTSLQRKFFLPPKKESSRLPPTAHFFTYYSIPVSCLVIRSQPM